MRRIAYPRGLKKAIPPLALAGAGLAATLAGAPAAHAEQWQDVGTYSTYAACEAAGQSKVAAGEAIAYKCSADTTGNFTTLSMRWG